MEGSHPQQASALTPVEGDACKLFFSIGTEQSAGSRHRKFLNYECTNNFNEIHVSLAASNRSLTLSLVYTRHPILPLKTKHKACMLIQSETRHLRHPPLQETVLLH